jgi:hypothetical protein
LITPQLTAKCAKDSQRTQRGNKIYEKICYNILCELSGKLRVSAVKRRLLS